MIDPRAAASHVIWATRGRRWGFRFLLDGGLPDPLVQYERAFRDLDGERAVVARNGTVVALRLPDPEGRKDSARRLIPHDFVLLDDIGAAIDSVEVALLEIWPVVSDAYAKVWVSERPPSRAEVIACLG